MEISHSEPCLTLERNGTHYTLLGTAHISSASVAKVEELINSGHFDAVAVELCASRHQAMMDPDSLARMDLFAVIREQRAAMVAAHLALSAYQQRLAEQCGIEPGAEQRIALRLANEHGLGVLLIDRDIGVTLKRTAHNLNWWKRWTLFSGLVVSLLSREQVTAEEIEQLKQGDVLETTFAEFAEDRADLFEPLIAERDQYMAAQLLQKSTDYQRVLVVIGAGHLQGLAAHLTKADPAMAAATLTQLETIPPRSSLWKLVPWLVVAVILSAFGYGFTQSPELGWDLVLNWVVINGGLSALGALLATAHPLTIVGAFVAAPLTSLNPTIGAGMVTAGLELMLRRPSVGDFRQLRDQITQLSGWWRNRVSRILLVFIFSSLGSMIGTYVAGFHIISRIFG